MDWIIWLVVIVVIVAVIWWLLNRNSRSGAGTGAADTGKVRGAAGVHERAGHAGSVRDGPFRCAGPGGGCHRAGS